MREVLGCLWHIYRTLHHATVTVLSNESRMVTHITSRVTSHVSTHLFIHPSTKLRCVLYSLNYSKRT